MPSLDLESEHPCIAVLLSWCGGRTLLAGSLVANFLAVLSSYLTASSLHLKLLEKTQFGAMRLALVSVLLVVAASAAIVSATDPWYFFFFFFFFLGCWFLVGGGSGRVRRFCVLICFSDCRGHRWAALTLCLFNFLPLQRRDVWIQHLLPQQLQDRVVRGRTVCAWALRGC